jgi:hypothetical protein
MTIINQKQQTLTVALAPNAEGGATRRLIVLIPGIDTDFTPVVRRVWEIANVNGAHVKFLSLCDDAIQESSLRRRLVTMSALVNDGRVTAEAEVIPGRDWVEAVRSRWQAGDMLVCLAGQRTGLLHKPLSQILGSDLKVPLTILSGLTAPIEARSKWYTQVIVWVGLIAIVLGFGLLQVGIYQDANAWTTVLMLGSIGIEYWLIWLWNSLF